MPWRHAALGAARLAGGVALTVALWRPRAAGQRANLVLQKAIASLVADYTGVAQPWDLESCGQKIDNALRTYSKERSKIQGRVRKASKRKAPGGSDGGDGGGGSTDLAPCDASSTGVDELVEHDSTIYVCPLRQSPCTPPHPAQAALTPSTELPVRKVPRTACPQCLPLKADVNALQAELASAKADLARAHERTSAESKRRLREEALGVAAAEQERRRLEVTHTAEKGALYGEHAKREASTAKALAKAKAKAAESAASIKALSQKLQELKAQKLSNEGAAGRARREADEEILRLTSRVAELDASLGKCVRDVAVTQAEAGAKVQAAAARAKCMQEQLERRQHELQAQIESLSYGGRADAAKRIAAAEAARVASDQAQLELAVRCEGVEADREKMLAHLNRGNRAKDALEVKVAELEQEVATKLKLINEQFAAIDDDGDGDTPMRSASPTSPLELFAIRRDRPGKGGGSWSWELIEIILEMLSNGTPPSAIPSNIMATARHLLPSVDDVKVPTVRYCQQLRRVLRAVAETLAAYSVGKMVRWRQLATDGTSRRQISLQNCVIAGQEEVDGPITRVNMRIFIPEGGTAEQECGAIIDQVLKRGGQRLEVWGEEMATRHPDAKHDIPRATALNIAKLGGAGAISTDTCNQARKLRALLKEEVKKAVQLQCGARWDAMTPAEQEAAVHVVEIDCWNHLRNIWLGAAMNALSKSIKDELDDSLAQCDPRLRVSTEIEQLIRAIDKEFSQMGNYAKGHGAKQFGPWLKRTYPSDFVLTEERAQGSRQVSPRPPQALRALPALQIVPSAPLHRR